MTQSECTRAYIRESGSMKSIKEGLANNGIYFNYDLLVLAVADFISRAPDYARAKWIKSFCSDLRKEIKIKIKEDLIND